MDVSKKFDDIPSEDFTVQVRHAFEQWSAWRRNPHVNDKQSFYAIAVQTIVPVIDTNNPPRASLSYWGIIDMQETPEEDLQFEIYRRFYAAQKTLGESQIIALGILDLKAVACRQVATAF